jgi:hypothetical protein
MEYEAGTFLLSLHGFWDDNIGYTNINGKVWLAILYDTLGQGVIGF